MARQKKATNGANLGFEEKLWQAADKMRGHMDAAEYKHVALGLVFLKYISDAFEEFRAKLAKVPGANSEDRDEYVAENVFWVPKEARWTYLQSKAKSGDQEKGRQLDIGQLIDRAMDLIEKENPPLKGVLPKDYGRPSLNKTQLGELIDLMSGIGMGQEAGKGKDILGRVYEYFLGRFASAEGKAGGEFYTPQSVVKLLVEMIEPYKGRVYDPCCGSGGMFVQSEKFVEAHGGKLSDLSIYGQESNPTTWRLCQMNLAIRGVECNLGPHHADSFHNDLHKDLKADFILANPPFNISDWGGDRLREDVRWKYGTPPVGNANYAWVQHIIHHLAPAGMAGFILANGSMSANQSGEGDIRRAIIEADFVDCMVALPGQLFYTTQIPACLWFLTRSKTAKPFRHRKGETLFIDCRKVGVLVDRIHRDLSDADIKRIAQTYHAWRGYRYDPPEIGPGTTKGVALPPYEDVPGFCKSATLEEIRAHGYILTPGRYVGAEAAEEDDEPFDQRMSKLVAKLEEQFAESARLEKTIRANLKGLGR
jgi:type I restriction enzyme M protein